MLKMERFEAFGFKEFFEMRYLALPGFVTHPAHHDHFFSTGQFVREGLVGAKYHVLTALRTGYYSNFIKYVALFQRFISGLQLIPLFICCLLIGAANIAPH